MGCVPRATQPLPVFQQYGAQLFPLALWEEVTGGLEPHLFSHAPSLLGKLRVNEGSAALLLVNEVRPQQAVVVGETALQQAHGEPVGIVQERDDHTHDIGRNVDLHFSTSRGGCSRDACARQCGVGY